MRRIAVLALSTASVGAIALAAATPAFAQDAPAPAPENCAAITDDAQRQACAEAAETAAPNANAGDQATVPSGTPASAEGTQGSTGTIVVTGSRLRRDERNSPDPVTIIDPSMEAREGKFDTAEVLQSSPVAAGSTQITSAISSNFVVNGGEGVQTISLRGLGANRTLVLLNGRRAGPAGVRGGVSAFDLNVIPVDAIQSVDILKTGASSIYGSDAVAGVVNLITKKDLEGFQLRGFSSVPENSGGEQYSISGTYGTKLGDRGHAMIGLNFHRQRELERGDRDFLGCEEEYVTNADGDRVDPVDPRTGDPYCGAFPTDQIFIANVGLMSGNNLRGPCVPAIPGTPAAGICPANFTRRAIGAIQYNRPGQNLDQYLSTPGQVGSFFNPTNDTQFTAPTGFFPVGSFTADGLALANNFDSRALGDSVIPDTKRFTVFAEAGYELSDRVELYFEGLYNRRKTKTDASRQLFFYQFPGSGDTVYSEAFGAYYLPYFFCDGTTCDPNAVGDPLNAGFGGANLLQPVIYAPFNSSTDVKYYRGVAGLRADLDNVLSNGFVDFHVQHSRSDGDYARQVIFRDAIEFGVAEFRTDLCEGTVTAIRGVPCIDINYTDPRVLAGNFTPEERAFLFGWDKGNTLYKQTSAEVTAGGDLFELPAGPVKAALGLHFRRDSINDTPGEVTLSDNVWGSTTSGVTAGRQITKEAFGEIEIPILENAPIARSLTFSGAARVTNTNAKRAFDGQEDSDNGNWTYKLAGNWQVTDWLRFRATYGTSFRSPALFEQFLASESGFLGQGLDPCINYGLKDNATLAANCASLGIPDNYAGAGSSFETFSEGGVGLLDPETSKAFTLSAIFTPQSWFWDGGQFSFTVDYIDINVKDQVTQLGAGSILAGCYTSDNFENEPLCDLIVRKPDAPNQYNIVTVTDPYLNIDQQRNKSLDFTTRFRQDLGSLGSLSLLAQMTYQLKDKYTLFQGVSDSFNGEVGDPKWVGDMNLTWRKAPFTVTYGLQIISKTNDFEDLEDVGGANLNADNCLATAAAYALRGGPYCPVYKLPRVAYHSLSAELEVNKNFNFLLGVSNIFDKKPPRVSTVGTPISGFGQVPLLGSYYDYFGRRFFVSAQAKF
ncbi:TonB-dependent receptor domain-containing protein [Sphingomonas edaphi]|uniref:TonB-dependent receptor n=1 Tax=Sphingomonas edaphi TaxID=2315689 RepID=A0A418PXQ6_9SPHN|nr:TonB-dependent receptor [Sphingomonas edaphi]RIX26990.1 TonB-dependent receptor [Sphingomonas edaphi]